MQKLLGGVTTRIKCELRGNVDTEQTLYQNGRKNQLKLVWYTKTFRFYRAITHYDIFFVVLYHSCIQFKNRKFSCFFTSTP
jgi:hypothetical protein